LSPDGSKVASGGRDGSLKVWSLADGRALSAWSPHKEIVHDIAFAPDGRANATVGADHQAHVTHLQSALQPSQTFSWEHDDETYGVTFSLDGNLVVTTGREGKIMVARAFDGNVIAVDHDRSILKAHPVFSKDGGTLLVAAAAYVMHFSLPRRGLGRNSHRPRVASAFAADRRHEGPFSRRVTERVLSDASRRSRRESSRG